MRPATLTLGTRQVGEGQPCFVLAEVASAHGGSADVALRMLESAFKMGADGIKFQLFRAEHARGARGTPAARTSTRSSSRRRSGRRCSGPRGPPGLTVLVEAFDLPSLSWPRRRASTRYKIHSTDMENPDFIRAVGAARRPVFFATGGVPEDAVREALDLVGNAPVGLLHGFQTFPTPIEEIRFRELTAWKDRYRVPVGFLDHTDGGSAFALVAPALAVAYGADLVEKHFTLDRSEKGFDYQSSLNPEDFYRMVELLRAGRARGRRRPAAESEGAKRYHRADGALHRGRAS